MAKRPNLGQISSTVFTVSQLNTAYEKIDTAFDNTLSRDGSTPNTMLADLDMNSNDILNVGVLDGDQINVNTVYIGGQPFNGTLTWRSDWLTATSYKENDLVKINSNVYICLDEHTSGVFANDLAASRWELFVENTVGPTGPNGANGVEGPAGEGVPTGGTIGQVLAKIDGTDYNTEWVNPSSLVISAPTESIIIAVSDESTALTTGTAKVTFRMPYAFTVTAVRASLKTAQTSGSIFTVDINEGGTSILSTKLTIDNTEKTSTTATTAAVISDSALADDSEITVDIDQVGDGTAVGLKIVLVGHQ